MLYIRVSSGTPVKEEQVRKLCRFLKDKRKKEDAEKLGDDLDVDSFVASSDLKKIYYESDGEVFFLQDSKGVRMADEADTYIYSDKYDVLFFLCDDELFYVTTKAKSYSALGTTA